MIEPQDDQPPAARRHRPTIREQLNEPVKWRTVLIVGWCVYCIWVVVPELGERPFTVAIVAALIGGPVFALKVWADGDTWKEALNVGLGMAILFPIVAVVVTYPSETLALTIALFKAAAAAIQ